MTEHVQSALDLFRLYFRRYPRIEMMPFNLGGLTEAGRLYLMPARNGKNLVERHRLALWKYPYLDVFKARIRSRTDFRPERGKTPQVQQQEALWKKVQEEHFSKRRFTMHLGFLPSYYNVSMVDAPMFPVKFRVWRQMRGLVLDSAPSESQGYVHWSSFVPEGSPEHTAIQASLDLAEKARSKPIKPSRAEIEALQQTLRERIAAVPA